MNLLLQICALSALLYGLALMIAPAWLLSFYGLSIDDAGALLGRLSGSYLVGFALLNGFASRALDISGLRLLLTADIVSALLGTVIALKAQLDGLMNTAGWEIVLFEAFFLAGFSYYLVKVRSWPKKG